MLSKMYLIPIECCSCGKEVPMEFRELINRAIKEKADGWPAIGIVCKKCEKEIDQWLKEND